MLKLTTSLQVALICMCLIFLWGTARGNDCNAGFLSSGWISPSEDLHIEKGKPWEMFCVLNTSHPEGQGGSWKNLSFYIDNKLEKEPEVKMFNETAIRLYIPVSSVSSNAPPSDFYSVQCKLNRSKGICLRNVYVGYPPQDVTDFKCTSYNWERLECVWREPHNPIETTYALSYKVLLRSRRMTTPCPRSLNLQHRFLSKTVDADNQQGSCEWNEITTPSYQYTAKSFNFSMTMSNELAANKTQYLGLVDNYAIVIPKQMEELNQTQATSSSAKIRWKVPFNLQLFPPGLEFKVTYYIRASWVDQTVFYNVPEATNLEWTNKTVVYELELQLPYANTNYSLSVYARSAAANKSDDYFWSQPATISVKTSANRPCNSPEASIGSFEVIPSGFNSRSATVRWSQLPAECENGPNAGYAVTILDAQRNEIESKNVTGVNVTNTVFDNLATDKSYDFVLQSYNDVGYSQNASKVFIPMIRNMPTTPESVMRITYNDTFFGVQWMPSMASRALSMATFGSRARNDEQLNYPQTLSNYTVFWCRTVRDSPVQCEGRLYSQVVPASQTSLNVTVPDPRTNYQFAVEANQGSFSSGMVWSTCIVMANGNGSQVKQLEVRPLSSFSLEVSWNLPCSVQNGVIDGFNIYYCPVEDVDIYGDEEPDCLSEPIQSPIRVPNNVSKWIIDQLEPYTFYKVVMSVRTQFGEGQSSNPVLNRTAEGRPSRPLGLDLVEVTNRSLSITWRPPNNPNGASTSYQVFRSNDTNPWVTTEKTEASMEVESYSGYVISVQACNGPALCSELSESISVKTQIGVPGKPGQPSIKSSTDNSSSIEIKWTAPVILAGPTYMSIINITGGDNEYNFTAFGNATDRSIDSTTVCQPGLDLKVRVRSVNQAENGDFLMGPWSVDGEYQCKPEGLSIGQILGITFGAALLVLIVVAISFLGRRVQVQKTKAREAEIVLPWEKTGNSEISSSGGVKQVAGHPKEVGGFGFNTKTNYYGQLDAKIGRITNPPPVINMEKLQNTQEQQSTTPTEVDCAVDRESRSSGHSSGPDSLSWHRTSRSELSSDSGAELEAPNSPSPDVFVNAPADPFAKSLAVARSSQNVAEVSGHEDVDRVQYSAVQLRDSQRNGGSAPDLAQQLPNPYVRVGVAPVAQIAPAQSVGYVTLGPSYVTDSAVSSPNASPNLSVGSNESLIVKSERDTRPTVKIVPLKRNSGGGSSGGYVEACIVTPASDLRASSTPGYVAFKSQEPVELDRPTISSPISPPQTTSGYVTLGANSAGATPTANATSTHYVKMGSQSNHLSYV